MKGLTFKEKRKSLGLTQEQLAVKLDVDRRTIINYEKGFKIPHQKMMILDSLYKEVFGVTEEIEGPNKFIELPTKQYAITAPVTLTSSTVHPGALSLEELNALPQKGFIVDTENFTQGRYLAFAISTDSMDDGSLNSFPKDSVIFTRELKKDLWENIRYKTFPYWVIYTSKSKTPLFKEIIEYDSDKGYIICHSLNPNPEYSDFVLQIEDITELYYVISSDKNTYVVK